MGLPSCAVGTWKSPALEGVASFGFFWSRAERTVLPTNRNSAYQKPMRHSTPLNGFFVGILSKPKNLERLLNLARHTALVLMQPA